MFRMGRRAFLKMNINMPPLTPFDLYIHIISLVYTVYFTHLLRSQSNIETEKFQQQKIDIFGFSTNLHLVLLTFLWILIFSFQYSRIEIVCCFWCFENNVKFELFANILCVIVYHHSPLHSLSNILNIKIFMVSGRKRVPSVFHSTFSCRKV